MGAIARTRPFDRDWNLLCHGRVTEWRNILHPGLFVEVGGKQPAGFVQQIYPDSARSRKFPLPNGATGILPSA